MQMLWQVWDIIEVHFDLARFQDKLTEIETSDDVRRISGNLLTTYSLITELQSKFLKCFFSLQS